MLVHLVNAELYVPVYPHLIFHCNFYVFRGNGDVWFKADEVATVLTPEQNNQMLATHTSVMINPNDILKSIPAN